MLHLNLVRNLSGIPLEMAACIHDLQFLTGAAGTLPSLRDLARAGSPFLRKAVATLLQARDYDEGGQTCSGSNWQ